MHNDFYEHVSTVRGSNFFYPVAWSEFLPFYANTQTPDFELADIRVSVKVPEPAIYAEMQFERWSAITDSYTEAGAISATVGFGGFHRLQSSSSFALAIEEPEDDTVTGSDSSSVSNDSSYTPPTFSATFYSITLNTATDVRDNTHVFETITEFDSQFFTTQKGTSQVLTNYFSSTAKEFCQVFPTAHDITQITVLTDAPGTADSVFFLARSLANRHFRMKYYLPKKVKIMNTVQWGDFDDIASIHTGTSVFIPYLRLNRAPVRVDYGQTSEGTIQITYPGRPIVSLTVLTFTDGGETTTHSTVSNLQTVSTTYIGNTAPVLAFTTFWTSATSNHLAEIAGGGLSLLELKVQLASYSNFGSYEETVPGLSVETVSTIGGSRTITQSLNGFNVLTFPESVYQQQVLIHSHFGAYAAKYSPIAGYAPLLASFTGSSPIYRVAATSLSKTLQGASFKGYFPYGASIIANVFQLVTCSDGSHELSVRVTESSTFKSVGLQGTVSTVPTIIIEDDNMRTVITTQSTSKSVFSIVSQFITTYTDTVFYNTAKMSSNSGLFTLRRIDYKSSTRSQVMQLNLSGPVGGTARVELDAGGNLGGFFGRNSGVFGGIDWGLMLLGVTKETTVMLNWGNWAATRYQINTASFTQAEINRTTYRILRGEQNIFQTSLRIKPAEILNFSHKEQFRLEILNISYTDYATVNYPLVENQSRFERWVTSSPLFPARHLDNTRNTAVVTPL